MKATGWLIVGMAITAILLICAVAFGQYSDPNRFCLCHHRGCQFPTYSTNEVDGCVWYWHKADVQFQHGTNFDLTQIWSDGAFGTTNGTVKLTRIPSNSTWHLEYLDGTNSYDGFSPATECTGQHRDGECNWTLNPVSTSFAGTGSWSVVTCTNFDFVVNCPGYGICGSEDCNDSGCCQLLKNYGFCPEDQSCADCFASFCADPVNCGGCCSVVLSSRQDCVTMLTNGAATATANFFCGATCSTGRLQIAAAWGYDVDTGGSSNQWQMLTAPAQMWQAQLYTCNNQCSVTWTGMVTQGSSFLGGFGTNRTGYATMARTDRGYAITFANGFTVYDLHPMLYGLEFPALPDVTFSYSTNAFWESDGGIVSGKFVHVEGSYQF